MRSHPRFDGETYDEPRDQVRLGGQLERVQKLMADGEWRTLADIARLVQGSEAGVSARLRDLRKPRFGAYRVQRENIGGGLFMYRVLVPESGQLQMFEP